MGIETALLGAPLASATAGASTVGLLGAGGVLGAGTGIGATIGAGLAGIGSALPYISGGLQVLGGFQEQQAAREQASLATQQAYAQAGETGRVTAKEAFMAKEDAESARRQQKLAFLKSGVTLEGSPLLLMEETRQKGLQNVEEIMKAGSASFASSIAEGRLRANQYKTAGRKSFAEGLMGAYQTYSGL